MKCQRNGGILKEGPQEMNLGGQIVGGWRGAQGQLCPHWQHSSPADKRWTRVKNWEARTKTGDE